MTTPSSGPAATDRASARRIVLAQGWNAVAYQVLNPGIEHWFTPGRDAVVGFARFGRWRVVVGAPVCAAERLAEVAGEFEADARAHHERVLFFGAGSRLESLLAHSGDHALVSLGAQPVWDPRTWDATVRRHGSLRAQLNRARNKGVRIDRWLAADVAPLRAVLGDWLANRGLPPLRFMTSPELLDDLADRRVFVASREARVIGFIVATPVPARGGWLVEQWPRARDAPNGTTHLLVDAVMRDVADGGADYLTLGLSPLSRRGDPPGYDPPPWMRPLVAWLRAHGRRFYNFGGLEAFKASLRPARWEPVYAIVTGSRFTPSMLRAVAGVFSGGSPEWFVARALAEAARREVAGSLSRASIARLRSTPQR